LELKDWGTARFSVNTIAPPVGFKLKRAGLEKGLRLGILGIGTGTSDKNWSAAGGMATAIALV